MSDKLLTTMATELPAILRQLQSTDPILHAAALQRLRDFADMSASYRTRKVSRRAMLRGAGLGFVALSVKRDD